MNEPLIVLDTLADARFQHHPTIIGEPGVRFYAGAPLINAEGRHLGVLCIIDMETRSAFGLAERALLSDLAALVVALMDKQRAGLLHRAIGGFANVIGLALITADAAGHINYWNAAAHLQPYWVARSSPDS